MLTVKHVETDGHESVVSATNVDSFEKNGKTRALVRVFGVSHFPAGVGEYQNGVIYVMNENGKTVAKYNLDDANRADFGR
jgi:hypothetical protein